MYKDMIVDYTLREVLDSRDFQQLKRLLFWETKYAVALSFQVGPQQAPMKD